MRLYEFITQSFLATCSRSAVGHSTRVEISIRDEGFHTSGESLNRSTVTSHCA